MPTHDPTADLVQRAQDGDRDAYDALFANAAERLQLFVRLRLGAKLREKEQSLDLVQETYLAAHEAFSTFEDRDDGGFSRWLCRIAENRIRARAEHHGAKKRRPPGDLARVSQVLDELRTRTIGPASRAERVEERERLASALADSPSEDRDVVLMRFFEGLSVDEIADRLGTSESSVRRALGRATIRLGSCLERSDA